MEWLERIAHLMIEGLLVYGIIASLDERRAVADRQRDELLPLGTEGYCTGSCAG